MEEAALLSIAVVAAAGVAGILLGLRYRAAALLAASAAALAAGVARAVAGHWDAGTTALFALACVVVVQLGYLVALFGRSLLRR
ncbi:MAG TPA: hypothetical protein VHD15_11460 [Hyphomicrobiales bacterium]|nr:hypothetical protein [Hyphomicrobiales bacterium]